MSTLNSIAIALDHGWMLSNETGRELFLCAVAARDLLDYLRSNAGHNEDWPIQLKVDDLAVAEGLAAKLSSLERLTPRQTP